MSTLSLTLDQMTVTAETLVQPMENGAVRCLACAHRCVVKPGRRGICQVRFNEDGVLKVPWGYVAALNADPIEKKPFFHFLPGAQALTFGMLGCDFHCGYCFTRDTTILTSKGPLRLDAAFQQAGSPVTKTDGEIAYPSGLQAFTRSGTYHPVRAIFKHPYHGPLVTIKPFYLPAIQCTADHHVYATTDPGRSPEAVPAGSLTKNHYLAIPYLCQTTGPAVIHVAEVLSEQKITHRIPWKLTGEQRGAILEASRQGMTSREISTVIGKSSSYIRQIRSKAARVLISEEKTEGILIENQWVRFPKEHKPGIPLEIPLNEEMARLFGYYCSEGSVVQSKVRPNSLVLNFSFSPTELQHVEEVQDLLARHLGIVSRILVHPTTVTVTTTKASAALLFKILCGCGAQGKKVPAALFSAPKSVVAAFLAAYTDGDGHRYENGKITMTTVSQTLAYGIGMLVLSLGYLPSIYDTKMTREGIVQGRRVQRSPHQYTIVWYPNEHPGRKYVRADTAFLIPIRSIVSEEYQGEVFNMEVEEDHTYLANFTLVSNCQNWITSQTLRDPECEGSTSLARRASPSQLVRAARQSGAQVIASSYNEPLITSEWAVDIFKEAKAAGLMCAFVSNGNATPEALEYLRPYLTGYKIDLKTMQDKHYRQLGGVLQHVLDTIQRAHDLGLWVEVVTLVVPGFNDSPKELWDAARFIASVSQDIPWHVTGFHPDYKMSDRPATRAAGLEQAADIGQEAGLRYVYAGNLTGRVGSLENTVCPGCGETLIRRSGFTVLEYKITAQGTCPKCAKPIPGVWTDQPEKVQVGSGWMRFF